MRADPGGRRGAVAPGQAHAQVAGLVRDDLELERARRIAHDAMSDRLALAIRRAHDAAVATGRAIELVEQRGRMSGRGPARCERLDDSSDRINHVADLRTS